MTSDASHLTDSSSSKGGRAETGLSPAVAHVATLLTERIRSGAYRGGMMLPSERTLATEFGVSRVTVRQGIEEIERRGLLVRSARCRPLVRPADPVPFEDVSGAAIAPSSPLPATARRSIAVWLWPGPTDPGAASILRGIRRALPPDDVRIILECPTGDDLGHLETPEAAFLQRILGDSDVEGVILLYLGGEDNLPALQAIRDAGRPLVFIDRQPPAGFDGDYVGVDNVESSAAAVRHLIERGHRRIVHVTNREKVSTVAERHEGYRRALMRAGIPYRPELVLRFTGPAPEEPRRGDRLLAEELVALREQLGADAPTAAFVVNDHTALPLMEELRERGVSVPEEIALVGFDGIERRMPGKPVLTTVEQPYERIGMRAAQLMLERLGGHAGGPFRHVVLEGNLFVAASTAVPSEIGAPVIAPRL